MTSVLDSSINHPTSSAKFNDYRSRVRCHGSPFVIADFVVTSRLGDAGRSADRFSSDRVFRSIRCFGTFAASPSRFHRIFDFDHRRGNSSRSCWLWSLCFALRRLGWSRTPDRWVCSGWIRTFAFKWVIWCTRRRLHRAETKILNGKCPIACKQQTFSSVLLYSAFVSFQQLIQGHESNASGSVRSGRSIERTIARRRFDSLAELYGG